MISMKFSKKPSSRTPLASVPSIFNCADSKCITPEAVFDEVEESSNISVSLTADDHKSLGCELAEKGDDDSLRQALAHFEKGLLLAPGNHLLLDLKSQVLLHFDKFLLAIKAAEEVVKLAPTWSEGYVTLARAQREFGELELSQINMQAALSLDKDNAEYSAELLEINDLVEQLHAVRAKYEKEKTSNVSFDGTCHATYCASFQTTCSSSKSCCSKPVASPSHNIISPPHSTSLRHERDDRNSSKRDDVSQSDK